MTGRHAPITPTPPTHSRARASAAALAHPAADERGGDRGVRRAHGHARRERAGVDRVRRHRGGAGGERRDRGLRGAGETGASRARYGDRRGTRVDPVVAARGRHRRVGGRPGRLERVRGRARVGPAGGLGAGRRLPRLPDTCGRRPVDDGADPGRAVVAAARSGRGAVHSRWLLAAQLEPDRRLGAGENGVVDAAQRDGQPGLSRTRRRRARRNAIHRPAAQGRPAPRPRPARPRHRLRGAVGLVVLVPQRGQPQLPGCHAARHGLGRGVPADRPRGAVLRPQARWPEEAVGSQGATDGAGAACRPRDARDAWRAG